MKPEKVFYTHFWLVKNNVVKPGHLTVAVQLNEDDLKYGFSFCSPKDLFIKKEGRINAQDRLDMKCYRLAGVTKKLNSKTPFEVCLEIAKLVHSFHGPSWSKDNYLMTQDPNTIDR